VLDKQDWYSPASDFRFIQNNLPQNSTAISDTNT
jgi:hypothetical protein